MLSAFGLNCTLKAGNESSSTQKLLDQVLGALQDYGVTTACERAVNHDIKPGVKTDQGPGDAWPALRKRIDEANIFVLATPIWMGHPSSVAQRVMERMDAFLDEKDDRDRMPSYPKVLTVAVVGNEDGAHNVSANLFQGLNDVGFTLAPNAVTYWVGEAMGDTNYVDLDHVPRVVSDATAMMVRNAIHLATLLRRAPYPGKD